MTTIAAISDLHGELPALPDAQIDVLVLGGDLCPDYAPRTMRGIERQAFWLGQAFWLDRALRGWLEAAAERDIEVVATWGNHDYLGEAWEYRSLFDSLPWHLLVDDEVTLRCGLRVWGTPWTPRLPFWAFHGTDNTLRLRAEAIPEGLDILVSHGPPLQYGDLVPSSSHNARNGDEHVGDPTLNEAILRARPKLTVCGHIHEARGSYMLGSYPVVNVSAVDERYALYKNPWTVFETTDQGFSSAAEHGAGRIRTDISWL